VWELFWYRGPDRPQPRDGVTRIEILHPGDEVGEGLVRHCFFKVPKILGSGGVAQSWEWLTEVQRPVSWRYDDGAAWSRRGSRGSRTSTPVALALRETYEAFNPWMRRLGLEKYVHRRISRDNDTILPPRAASVGTEEEVRGERAADRGSEVFGVGAGRHSRLYQSPGRRRRWHAQVRCGLHARTGGAVALGMRWTLGEVRERLLQRASHRRRRGADARPSAARSRSRHR
jgi:hypothetical protein